MIPSISNEIRVKLQQEPNSFVQEVNPSVSISLIERPQSCFKNNKAWYGVCCRIQVLGKSQDTGYKVCIASSTNAPPRSPRHSPRPGQLIAC